MAHDLVAKTLGHLPRGAVGKDGRQGPPGPRGEQGPQGIPGPEGSDGADGAAGRDGAQGPEGPEGPQGPAGPRGSQGEPGPKGDTGERGPRGQSYGSTGGTGTQGPPGEQGPPGADGTGGGSAVTISASDPGAIGAGALWLDTTTDAFSDVVNFQLKVRNEADDDWLFAGWGETVNKAGNLNTWSGDGLQNAFVDLLPGETGNAAPLGAVLGVWDNGAGELTFVKAVDGAVSIRILNDDLYYINATGIHFGSTTGAQAIAAGTDGSSEAVALPVGSIFLGDNADVGELWLVTAPDTSSRIGTQAAFVDVIGDPSSATAEDVANKINELLGALTATGLMAAS